VLFALPMVAVIGSITSAPVPSDLAVIAWGGALLFLVLFAAVFTLVRFDRPLWASAGWSNGSVADQRASATARAARPPTAWCTSATSWSTALGLAVGGRASAAAVGNWGLDYLALVAALYAVGCHAPAEPRAARLRAAAVLSMIPITPAGLGFVEAGLTATLVAAGVPDPTPCSPRSPTASCPTGCPCRPGSSLGALPSALRQGRRNGNGNGDATATARRRAPVAEPADR
jgi:uncharacterized membrane protein YbhN (UPF0104 family)